MERALPGLYGATNGTIDRQACVGMCFAFGWGYGGSIDRRPHPRKAMPSHHIIHPMVHAFLGGPNPNKEIDPAAPLCDDSTHYAD